MQCEAPELLRVPPPDQGSYQRPPRELFHIAADPLEARDVYADHRDVARDLEWQLERWVEQRIGPNTDPVRYEAQCGLTGPMRNRMALERMNMTFEQFQREVAYL